MLLLPFQVVGRTLLGIILHGARTHFVRPIRNPFRRLNKRSARDHAIFQGAQNKEQAIH